ncbi:MAG: Ppx/GppA phosphatase family protein [Polyangiaceae bacterium]|jgi:exopolyphosphatase/guanosine-5'-triphosphate,3'-diphosphate pyrophosphatase
MRIATVDIGTNTVLLLIVEARAEGLAPILERACITRLGEGVDRTRELALAAIERTNAVLSEYAALVGQHAVDRVAVVGTSAMRDARGGAAVRDHVCSVFGVEPRVLTGGEEARLTFRGAVSGFDPPASGEVAVFDIGGGSTEVVLGRVPSGSVVSYAESFDIGSVRLTERIVKHDPPSTDEIEAIERAARAAFSPVPALRGPEPPVGVAGTVTTLAAVATGLAPYDGAALHGRVLTRAALAEVVRRLADMDGETRRGVPGMEPKRADVIVAGGLVVLALLDHWQADALRVSDRGVRWGLAEELVASPLPG